MTHDETTTKRHTVENDAPTPQASADAIPASDTTGSAVEGLAAPSLTTSAGEAAAVDDPHEGALPAGYDWPTHGGYLGCLLGVVTAFVLAPLGYIIFGFLGATLASALGGFGVALAAIVTIAVYLTVFVALARLGWALGKRFYREYPQNQRA